MDFLRKYRNLVFFVGLVLALLANFAVFSYQNGKIKSLQGKNEQLKTEIFNKNLLINQLEFITAKQNEAIAEMEKNANEKANLDKELKKQREKILKDLGDDTSINQPLRDSVDFIIARLREQENAK
ncbi:hypothetical protein OFN70_07425 [Campylobacter sp. CN_NE3]|uniref:hypothetical protein n=1 Tax=Campylobacter sp. CN_NE3 TaxID=2984149 RepID=UPI0022E9F76E|nr:hypothetical protein [Campylobacter sp. CN_NE3]MDA3069354.1 hypothetical protein [Campylobacter sp. CN_NE3]